jgi:hypothetical protein
MIDKMYRIGPKSSCEASHEWANEFRLANKCPECKYFKEDFGKDGVDVYVCERPDVSAVNFVDPVMVYIVRVDFLALFKDEAAKYLKTGHIYHENGKLIESHVTFTGVKKLPIYGGKDSRYYGDCSICGLPKYWPAYPYYVVESDVEDDEKIIYETWSIGGLGISESLQARIDRKKWKGINIIPMRVVSQAEHEAIEEKNKRETRWK